MRILITGGAGFLGHHCVEHLLKTTDYELVILDRIDSSSNLNRLTAMGCWEQERGRVSVLFHDLKAALPSSLVGQIGPVQQIWHLAAWSDVARSIADPVGCVYDNVMGTLNLLEYARYVDGLDRLLYCSTDEVFGPKREGLCQEDDGYRSSTPYAASKAGGEELTVAYATTYKLPVLISHCMNIFGERQHPEKFIPMTIGKVLRGETVQIHGDFSTVLPGPEQRKAYLIGSRFWIHAREVASAMSYLMVHGVLGQKYNIVGDVERSNLVIATHIARLLGQQLRHALVDGAVVRPGHDLRYALDGAKLAALGWRPSVHFMDALERTVQYTVEHPEWLHGTPTRPMQSTNTLTVS